MGPGSWETVGEAGSKAGLKQESWGATGPAGRAGWAWPHLPKGSEDSRLDPPGVVPSTDPVWPGSMKGQDRLPCPQDCSRSCHQMEGTQSRSRGWPGWDPSGNESLGPCLPHSHPWARMPPWLGTEVIQRQASPGPHAQLPSHTWGWASWDQVMGRERPCQSQTPMPPPRSPVLRLPGSLASGLCSAAWEVPQPRLAHALPTCAPSGSGHTCSRL